MRFVRRMENGTDRPFRLVRPGPGKPPAASSLLELNLAGVEFGHNPNDPNDQTDPRTLPARFDSDADVGVYAALGYEGLRLPIPWEPMQPVPSGPLHEPFMVRLDAGIASITSRGMVCDFDVHAYCRYREASTTSGGTGGGSTSMALADGMRATFNADTLADKQQWKNAGGRQVVIQALWSDLEPTKGTLDQPAVGRLKQQLADCATAGLGVIFHFSSHYTPDWIKNGPDRAPRFRAQNYNEWASENRLGDDVVDVVFSKVAREAIASWQARLWAELTAAEKAQIVGFRLGGGPYGELHYPSPGEPRRYWGNSDPVRTGVGLADGMVQCAAPTDFTGTPSPEFVEWYLDALVRFMRWQITQLRALGYAGPAHMLHPSFGLRSNMNYGETGWSYQVAEGVDWDRQVAAYSDAQVWPQCTWVNGVDPVPGGLPDSDRAAWRKMLDIARKYGRTALLAGENTGGSAERGWDDNASIDRMFGSDGAYTPGRYVGLSWLNFPRLVGRVGGVHATLTHLSQHMPTTTVTATGTTTAGRLLVLGSPEFPATHLGDLWRRLAERYRNNPLVRFGLMNEPHDLPAVAGVVNGPALNSNGSFDSNADGWNSNATLARVTTPVHSGAGALRLTATQAGRLDVRSNNAFPVTAGGTYRVSSWWRSAAVSRQAWTQIDFFDAAGAYITSATVGFQMTSTTSWTEQAGTVTAPARAATARLICSAQGPIVAGEVHYLDDVAMQGEAGGMTPDQNWEHISQVAVDAVRATGATNFIRVSTHRWSSAAALSEAHPTWWIVDPLGKSGPDCHYYPDPNRNGVFKDEGDTFAASQAAARAAGFLDLAEKVTVELSAYGEWCRRAGVTGFLGETGIPNTIDSAEWNALLERILDTCARYGIDVAVWATGEQWGLTYELSVYVGSPPRPTNIAPVLERRLTRTPPPAPARTYSSYVRGY